MKLHKIKDTDFSHSARSRVFSDKAGYVKQKDYVAGKHIGEQLMGAVYNKRRARWYGQKSYLDFYMYKHYMSSPKKHYNESVKDFEHGIQKAINDSFGKVLK